MKELNREFTLDINNPYLKVLLIVAALGILALMIATSIIKGRDFKAKYSGEVLKKGKTFNINWLVGTKRKYNTFHNFSNFYLVIENNEGKREKYYCRMQGYDFCRVGDMVEKKVGKYSNPKPIKKVTNKNGSGSMRETIHYSGILDQIEKMKTGIY